MAQDVAFLNAFCRRFDLIYVEEGVMGGRPVHWFIDFKNERRYYTTQEMAAKMNVIVPCQFQDSA